MRGLGPRGSVNSKQTKTLKDAGHYMIRWVREHRSKLYGGRPGRPEYYNLHRQSPGTPGRARAKVCAANLGGVAAVHAPWSLFISTRATKPRQPWRPEPLTSGYRALKILDYEWDKVSDSVNIPVYGVRQPHRPSVRWWPQAPKNKPRGKNLRMQKLNAWPAPIVDYPMVIIASGTV